MIEPDKEINAQSPKNQEEEKKLFFVEEIKIEELAIDGICGVY
ncbi:MAG: mycofactocin precursor [Deltaproteobacteria bacterium]|nr:mycofactocin precursor [Deltaproteobacteria bacterium]